VPERRRRRRRDRRRSMVRRPLRRRTRPGPERSTGELAPRAAAGAQAPALPGLGHSTMELGERPVPRSWTYPTRARARSTPGRAVQKPAGLRARRLQEPPTTGRRWEAKRAPPPAVPSRRPQARGRQVPAAPTTEPAGADSTTVPQVRPGRLERERPTTELARRALPTRRRAVRVRLQELEPQRALPRPEPELPAEPSPATPMSGRRLGRRRAGILPRSAPLRAGPGLQPALRVRPARPTQARLPLAPPRARLVGPIPLPLRGEVASLLPSRATAV